MAVLVSRAPALNRLRVSVGWLVCAIAVLLATVAVAWTVADRRSLAGDITTGCVMGIGSTVLAAFVLSRNPGQVIGWLFAIAGLSRAVAVFAAAWSVRALRTHPGSLPGGAFASWVKPGRRCRPWRWCR